MDVDSLVQRLLDEADRENAMREEFRPAISRPKAERALQSLLWLYGTREGSTASVYAAVALTEALEGTPAGKEPKA